ncbi:MAG: peptidoglycan DD-metalloendopeptidase family protein [Pseudomonadota bacterium]
MYLVPRALFRRLALIALAALGLQGCATPGRPPVADRSTDPQTRTPAAKQPANAQPGRSTWQRERGGVAPVYTVRRGDTLYSIAWRFDLDYLRFAKANAVAAPYRIYPGQRLRLTHTPARRQSATVTQPTIAKRPASTSRSTASKPVKPEPAAPPPTAAPRKAPPPGKAWSWPVAQKPWREFKQSGKGIDFRFPPGNKRTPLRSVAGGRVVYAGNGIGGFERLVIVKHGETLLSAYSFNGQLAVAEEQEIKAGARIADIKSDTRGTQQLHFELRQNGQAVNPRRYLP